MSYNTGEVRCDDIGYFILIMLDYSIRQESMNIDRRFIADPENLAPGLWNLDQNFNTPRSAPRASGRVLCPRNHTKKKGCHGPY